MKRIKETYLLFLIVMGLFTVASYSTYALFTASSTIENVVNFEATLTTNSNIIEYEMVTVPAGEIKIIELNVTNTHTAPLYYGAWYQIISPSDTSNITIGMYTDKNSTPGSGQIAAGTSLKLLVGIQNAGTTDALINIGTMGSLTSNLGLGTKRTLLASGWTPVVPDIELTNFNVNGTNTTTFPTTGTYVINPNCTGATASYDYSTKKFKISNISTTDTISCNPTLTTTTRTTMANYIINLLGTKTSVSSTSNNDDSTLEKINSALDTGATSTDYRYRGVDPNNYIKFNDELWRIIGVFDQYSHGQTGQKLVKIIRNDSIGGYVWDKSGKNNFPSSSIYNLLNTAYYNSSNETGADYCCLYSYYGIFEFAKCNFTGVGIKDNYRGMIKNVTWYLGGYNSAATSSNMYKYERSTNTSSTYYYSGNAKTITNTPIGLMYASDYGYAAHSSCTNVTLANYSSQVCGGQNWLKQNSYEWTINHYTSSSDYVFEVDQGGALITYETYYFDFATRPTLYLDSSVYYISGNGSKTNPYIIAL